MAEEQGHVHLRTAQEDLEHRVTILEKTNVFLLQILAIHNEDLGFFLRHAHQSLYNSGPSEPIELNGDLERTGSETDAQGDWAERGFPR